MKIRLPKGRAYYPASPNEPEWLLCWIPPEELATLVQEDRIRASALAEHPSGLEVEVSQDGFAEFDLDLGVSPGALYETYASLRQQGVLPESGVVAAAQLESLAQAGERPAATHRTIERLPVARGAPLSEPEWTDGDDPRAVMQQL